MPMNSEQSKWLCLTTGNKLWGDLWKQVALSEESDKNQKFTEEINSSNLSEEEKEVQIKQLNEESMKNLQELNDETDALKNQAVMLQVQVEDEEKKRKILAYVRSTIQDIQADIKQAFNTQVEFVKTKIIQEQKKANIAMFDNDNMAFDFMEDINDLPKEFFEGEMKAKWDQAGVRIAMLELEMRDGNLFTEDEITKELFTPLVQQQILPETFVPNAYSAVQKMIDETNSLYMKELATAKEEDNVVLDVIKDTIDTSANIIKASLKISEATGALTKDQKLLGENITDIITITTTTTIDTVDTLYRTGDVSAAVQAIFNDMANTVGKTIETAMGRTPDSKTISTFVVLAMQSSAIGVKVVTDDDPADAFLDSLEDILTKGCDFGVNASDEYTANILKIVKFSIKNAFAGKAYVEKVQKEIREMHPFDPKKALVICIKGIEAAVSKSFEIKKIIETQQKYAAKQAAEEKLAGMDPESEEAKEVQELATALDKELNPKKYKDETKKPKASKGAIADKGVTISSITKVLGAGGFDPSDLKGIQIPENAIQDAVEKIKKAEEETAETLKTEMNRMLAEEEQELQKQIALLQSIDETAPSDKDLQTIEKLLAQLQRDREIWDRVFSLAGKGAKAAKAALTVLGPGVTMVQLIKAISEVVVRTKEVLNWRDNLEDAEVVSNPYLTSVQGMLKQQTEHLTQDSISMALLIIKLAGDIMTLTPASPVGKLISAGADLAIEAEEFIYRNYKRAQLKKAWQQTKIALEHPEYRRQNLYVRKLNPTLAKYTIAFGAVVAKDPVAISTMNKIGVTTEMLEHPSAGVDKVKKYLDTRYNKDMDVKIKYVPDTDWVRGLPAITLEETHWFIVSSKAREMHNGCVFDDAIIKASLKQLNDTKKAFLAKQGVEEVRAYCASFENLKNNFDKFNATDKKGSDLSTLNSVKEEYLGLIEAENENMNSVKNAIEKRLAQLAE